MRHAREFGSFSELQRLAADVDRERHPAEKRDNKTKEIFKAEKKITDVVVADTPGAENAPSELKRASKELTDAWFDPKSFESERVYEALGVRTFKKYVPTSGDYVYRLVWKKYFNAPDHVKPGDLASLKEFLSGTKFNEAVHTGLFALTSTVIGVQMAEGNMNGATFMAAVNTLVNVYPIMVQRYNRLRTNRNISKMEERRTGQRKIG